MEIHLFMLFILLSTKVGYGSLFLQHSKPFGHYRQPFYRPVADGHHHHHHPIGGPYNAFVGDIRGDKFTGDFNGFQQISSSGSKPPSLFRGVNYFPQDDHHAAAAYKESADETKREAEWQKRSSAVNESIDPRHYAIMVSDWNASRSYRVFFISLS